MALIPHPLPAKKNYNKEEEEEERMEAGEGSMTI